MLFADKENLKTLVAQELLEVRAKEMKFYARNLSMVGTHAALLAGFAFTILSQYQFKIADQGFLSYQQQVDLGMWPDPSTRPSLEEQAVMRGVVSWPWHVWCNQFGQLVHLLCTTLGMTLQLWTVYTCVVTNILGLHLALRGPEGSVDRAVRHMATQNQFALRKFVWGLLLFIVSIIFYSLTEYQFYVSFIISSSVMLVTTRMVKHLRGLVSTFYVPKDGTVTGQWEINDGKAKATQPGRGRANTATAADGSPAVGIFTMGEMLARVGSSRRSMRIGGGAKAPAKPPSRMAMHLGAIKARVQGRAQGTGTRWRASLQALGPTGMIADQEAR